MSAVGMSPFRQRIDPQLTASSSHWDPSTGIDIDPTITREDREQLLRLQRTIMGDDEARKEANWERHKQDMLLLGQQFRHPVGDEGLEVRGMELDEEPIEPEYQAQPTASEQREGEAMEVEQTSIAPVITIKEETPSPGYPPAGLGGIGRGRRITPHVLGGSTPTSAPGTPREFGYVPYMDRFRASGYESTASSGMETLEGGQDNVFRRPRTPPKSQTSQGKVRAWQRAQGQTESDSDRDQAKVAASGSPVVSPSVSHPQQPSGSQQSAIRPEVGEMTKIVQSDRLQASTVIKRSRRGALVKLSAVEHEVKLWG